MNDIVVSLGDESQKVGKEYKLSQLLCGHITERVINNVIKQSTEILDSSNITGNCARLRELWLQNLANIGGVLLPSEIIRATDEGRDPRDRAYKTSRILEVVRPLGSIKGCVGHPAAYMARPSLRADDAAKIYSNYILKKVCVT